MRFGLKNFINLRKPVFITLNITQKRPTPFGISLFFEN
ncbi:Transposase [Streptococcus salivarius K12]|uniref:Transposase n=1 Tax=Streptococcus salivarius K12 TaxID=1200793 RepID=J7TVN8_STRSL|nr:Transposase [Streptococcus salivarius K12]